MFVFLTGVETIRTPCVVLLTVVDAFVDAGEGFFSSSSVRSITPFDSVGFIGLGEAFESDFVVTGVVGAVDVFDIDAKGGVTVLLAAVAVGDEFAACAVEFCNAFDNSELGVFGFAGFGFIGNGVLVGGDCGTVLIIGDLFVGLAGGLF